MRRGPSRTDSTAYEAYFLHDNEKLSYLFSENRLSLISFYEMCAWQKHVSAERREQLSKQELRKRQLARYGKDTVRTLAFLQALANPVRLMIIKELQRRPLNVTEISNRLDIEQPSISRHLRLLYDSGVLQRRKKNNEVIYSVDDDLSGQLQQDLKWLI